MDFFGYGIPVGRYFGISVRLHFTFVIYAFMRVQQFGNLGLGLAFLIGLYVCILLHEFGHALAARWCDGEANDILLWPLGGLAFVRPAFHPTAYLITTVAGPFVTLVLWLLLSGTAVLLSHAWGPPIFQEQWQRWVFVYVRALGDLNLWLLLFNLIPAFPMDGGRIVRDTLWHWMSAEKATGIAVAISRLLAVLAVAWGLQPVLSGGSPHWMLILVAVFIFIQGSAENYAMQLESSRLDEFSVRERFRRGGKQRAFRQAVAEAQQNLAGVAFHQCAVCGRTERDEPRPDFRVCGDCSDGQEYCSEHLNSHSHR